MRFSDPSWRLINAYNVYVFDFAFFMNVEPKIDVQRCTSKTLWSTQTLKNTTKSKEYHYKTHKSPIRPCDVELNMFSVLLCPYFLDELFLLSDQVSKFFGFSNACLSDQHSSQSKLYFSTLQCNYYILNFVANHKLLLRYYLKSDKNSINQLIIKLLKLKNKK